MQAIPYGTIGQTDNEFSIIEREMKDNVRAQLCLAYKMGICVK